MVLQVHGFLLSTCTQAVITTLKELNLPYEIVPVPLFAGAHKDPQYIATKQPFGQIPVLVEEDGFQLFESRAIARYVILKYGPDSGLIPKGLREQALFEQAASIEGNNFYPFAYGISTEKVFKPMRGVQGDDARAAELTKALEEKLKAYEVILGKQKYLAGNEFTLADLLHLPYGTLITETIGFGGLKATPNVARWWADISSRESWKSTSKEVAAFAASLKK
ncbi:glutathione S-transferase [Phellopilus nigrolimitatus]|nr:glutathione S-transferase [Phellopilus nigrolimitatus]